MNTVSVSVDWLYEEQENNFYHSEFVPFLIFCTKKNLIDFNCAVYNVFVTLYESENEWRNNRVKAIFAANNVEYITKKNIITNFYNLKLRRANTEEQRDNIESKMKQKLKESLLEFHSPYTTLKKECDNEDIVVAETDWFYDVTGYKNPDFPIWLYCSEHNLIKNGTNFSFNIGQIVLKPSKVNNERNAEIIKWLNDLNIFASTVDDWLNRWKVLQHWEGLLTDEEIEKEYLKKKQYINNNNFQLL